MSVRAFTNDSASLLARVKKLIDEGHITTWAYDSDGHFTHTASQWRRKAWFEPQERSDKLRLRIIAPKSGMTREVFAVYHGRFIEMLIAHVSKKLTSARATPSDEPTLEG